MLILDKKNIPLYKRILSYFHPVWLMQERGKINPYLEVLIYRNRIQLATKDALYSDGIKYTPALAVINDDPAFIGQLKDVLILGVGLGSIVEIIRSLGHNPQFTLVEIDQIVLRWALEHLQSDEDAKLSPRNQDAEAFMAQNNATYDFIFIDIFDSRTVPAFASTTKFLQQCRKSLNPGGRLAFNYIVNDKEKWENTQLSFAGVFPDHRVISNDINRIFIAKI